MSLGTEIGPYVPFLRRYGRLLTGTESKGDRLVRQTLEEIVAAPETFPRKLGGNLGLHKMFHEVVSKAEPKWWNTRSTDDDVLYTPLYRSLLKLPLRAREAFLLAASEGFSYGDVGTILDQDEDTIERLVKSALDAAGGATLSSLLQNSTDRLIDPTPLEDGTSYEQLLSLTPVPYAPTVKTEQGKVRLAEHPLELPSSTLGQLELLRLDHLDEAIAARSEVGNLGGGFDRRITAVVKLLSEPITNDSSLRLANQVHAMAAMKGLIVEELTSSTAASLVAFIDQLVLYCEKFPSWREFNATEDGVSDGTEIQSLASAVAQSGTTVLAEDVQEAVAEAVVAGENAAPLERAYRDGMLHNVFSEAGRYLLARSKGIAKGFNEKIDKEIGEGLAIGLSNLLIAASTPLLALAVQLPAAWAWAGPALAAAKIVLGKK